MQRFLVALFAAFALLAVSFPAVEARSSNIHRRQTNAERFRRGEGPLVPANLRRHNIPTTTTAAYPSPVSTLPPRSGTVQCRGSDGSALGYIGANLTIVNTISEGSTCDLAGGVLSLVGGVVEETTSILGAVIGSVLEAGSSVVTEILGTSQEQNAVSWAYNSTSGCMKPSYTNKDGSVTPCNVLYDPISLKLSISADVKVDNLVAVDLYLIV